MKCFVCAFLGNRKAMKGLAIGIAFTIFAQFTACWTILNYAVMTFTKFGNNIDPHISSISLAIALIVGSLANHILADKLGRKKLNLISLMGSAFGLFATAFFYYLNINGYNLTAFTWMPVACLIFVIFISSAGIVSLQFVCSIENLPILVRYTVKFHEHFLVLITYNSFIPDSNSWNDDNLRFIELHLFCICEDLSDSFGFCRFTWLLINLWSREYCGFLFRVICVE